MSITEEWEGKPHTCWLLSSIASIASKSPSSVDTLFRVASSGGWQVSVDGRWYTVPTLSDAELKKYTTSNGAWVAYYEAGYREWLKDPKAPKDVRDYNDKESKNEKDLLDNRRYFEGVKAIFRYLSPDFADGWKPESQLIEEKVWNKDRRWIEVLITSLTDTGSRASLAVAATMLESDERDTIEGLHKHHGYTILGFADKNFQLVTDPDREKKVQYIKLYNSFAYHLKAFPPEGRKMGWDPKHKANTAAYGTPQFPEEIGDTKQPGVFYMPITDFTRLFGAVIYVGPKMNKN